MEGTPTNFTCAEPASAVRAPPQVELAASTFAFAFAFRIAASLPGGGLRRGGIERREAGRCGFAASNGRSLPCSDWEPEPRGSGDAAGSLNGGIGGAVLGGGTGGGKLPFILEPHKSTYSYCIESPTVRISQYLLGDVYHQDLIQRCSLRLPKACWPRHPLHGYLIILV